MSDKPATIFLPPAARYGLAALVAMAAAGLGWQSLTRHPAAAQVVTAAPAPAGVFRPSKEQWAGLQAADVQAREFRDQLVTDGNIAYDDDAMTPVFSPYSGRVARVMAKLGDVVARGEPLLAVEASEFVQGQSDVATARATLDNARATEQRQHALFDAGAAALKDWRQAQTDLATATAAWNAARGRLRILGKSEAEIDALEKAPVGRGEALVTAPIAGTVTQRQVGVGQYIQSAAGGAATPQFVIGDLSTVWLLANVREGDAPALRVGQPVEVSVLALPGRIFRAKLAWVAPAVDPVTHRLPVRVAVPNPDGVLKPQMFASFTIATGAAVQAPAVPEGAVMYDGEVVRVFVVAPDGSISGREIKIGRSQGGLVEVLSGLKAGERVIASGTLFIDRAVAGG